MFSHFVFELLASHMNVVVIPVPRICDEITWLDYSLRDSRYYHHLCYSDDIDKVLKKSFLQLVFKNGE